ncbi:hypothetical protein [Lacinutrix algicola]|uniref:hypothetical protein n=1 Tax=Lacinutrix algicola TaxID=342954 RepID=UPI0006E22C20|nr:hypothetical protein [Lacinutrix algicola]
MLKSEFISNILELLLDGDKEGIDAKLQLEYLTESDYEYTGSGVFIGFEHKNGIEKFKADKSDLILDGVRIKSTELEIGADCTLFFKNGLIDNLEIWSFSGNYPKKELSDYELTQEWKNSPDRKIIVNKTSG